MDRYEPTPETAQTLLKAHHYASLGRPFTEYLASALPLRSLNSIRQAAGGVVGMQVTGLNTQWAHRERQMPDLAAHLLTLLALFRAPYFNKTPGSLPDTERAYLYTFDHISFAAVMMDAQAAEEVRLGSDHRVLLPEVLTLVRSARRTTAARPRAIEQALAEWDASAARLGLATVLPRDRYEQVLGEAFVLFDARYGRHLRPPALKTA